MRASRGVSSVLRCVRYVTKPVHERRNESEWGRWCSEYTYRDRVSRPDARIPRASQRFVANADGRLSGRPSVCDGPRRTYSVHVGTRKMVNYAWPG